MSRLIIGFRKLAWALAALYIAVMALHAGWYMIVVDTWYMWPIEFIADNWRWYIGLLGVLALCGAGEYLERKMVR